MLTHVTSSASVRVLINTYTCTTRIYKHAGGKAKGNLMNEVQPKGMGSAAGNKRAGGGT